MGRPGAEGETPVFCLGWWYTLLPTRFHVSRGTLDTSPLEMFLNTGVSPSAPGLPMPFF